MNKLIVSACILSLFSGAVAVDALAARDSISIVGSSTVYPFSTTVAEQFGKITKFSTPKVESTGTGGGFKLFCAGVGADNPDIANASRAMKKTEFDSCVKNGVSEIVEVKIGYDGIVLANAKDAERMSLSRKDIYLALAKEVPDPKNEGKSMANPYQTWRDVNPALPAQKIEVLGPPPTSGTRDAFVELVMEPGCEEFPWIKDLKKKDEKTFKSICFTVREDGSYVEAGENDNLIVQKLEANKASFGIFGFSFLDQNSDKVQGSIVEGKEPTFEAIAAGEYPVSRPLYFYVKKAHIGSIPGIAEYLAEFTSEKTWGNEGYLADKGLIPMPEAERKSVADAVRKLTPFTLQ